MRAHQMSLDGEIARSAPPSRRGESSGTGFAAQGAGRRARRHGRLGVNVVCILNRDEPSLHGSGAGHAPARYRLFPPCNSDRLTRGGARSLQVVDASALRLTRVRFKAGIQPQQPSALSASGYHRKTCIMKFTGTKLRALRAKLRPPPYAVPGDSVPAERLPRDVGPR